MFYAKIFVERKTMSVFFLERLFYSFGQMGINGVCWNENDPSMEKYQQKQKRFVFGIGYFLVQSYKDLRFNEKYLIFSRNRIKYYYML